MARRETVGIVAALTAVLVAGCAPGSVQPSPAATTSPTLNLRLPTPTASPTPTSTPTSTTDAVASAARFTDLKSLGLHVQLHPPRRNDRHRRQDLGSVSCGGHAPSRPTVTRLLSLACGFGDNAWIFGPNIYESRRARAANAQRSGARPRA